MEELVENLKVNADCTAEDFKEGRVLLINKPLGWSSFDVVNKIRISFRQHLGIKKIKVGHAGTLDPLATGLLLICTGKATKQIDRLMGMDKEYVAAVTFGATTPSYDLETEADGTYDTAHIDRALLEEKLAGFLGQQLQAPPVFSAIKKDGRKSYELARKGKTPELEKREVHFLELELLHFEPPKARIRLLCSKGTYIRSFAHDLGRAVNSGAHLSALERSAIGPIRNENALSVDDFIKLLTELQTI